MAQHKQSDLIHSLDLARGYGDRTRADVVQAVESGELAICQGIRQPVLRDRRGLAVKGSGRFPISEQEPREWSKKEFVERAADEFDDAWQELRDGMRHGDVRAMKIWELLIGRPREAVDRHWASQDGPTAQVHVRADVTLEELRALKAMLDQEAEEQEDQP